MAQVVLSGQITDPERHSLPGISVTVHPVGVETIIAFGITDEDGRFSITLKAAADSVRLRAYGLGWAAQVRRLGNHSQVINLRMVSQPIALREVRVKPPPITQHRDTISYSVEAFKNKSDRVIADVIRKLPGIEVEADGRILYQGKPINKYYIQGLDLLENKYRLANDNLPADAVAQVQVLENHQPIRMLDSLVFSDRAALNIKLKKNVTATGTAHAGVGGLPLLWDANLTPMLFAPNNQFIISYQSNNTGLNVARQLKNISPGTVFSPLQNDDEKKDWLAIQPLATPSFSEMRWLNNNIQLGTVNYLKKLKNSVELRLNVGYVHDYQQQRGSTHTTYYTPSDTVHLLEKDYNQLFFRSLETRLTLQLNSNRKYIKNELVAKGNWDRQQGNIVLNDVPVNQQLSNPFFWLTNKMTDIFRIGKQLLTLQSSTALNRVPQSLAVTPGQFASLINAGNPYQTTNQTVLSNAFTTNNSLNMTRRVGPFTLLPELGLELQKQQLRSGISYWNKNENTSLSGDFANRLDWFKLTAWLRLKSQYQKNAWRLELDAPLNYYRFNIQDVLANKSQQLSRLVPEPRFSANYTINTFWSANNSLSYRNIFGEIDDIYYGYLLRTYRTLQRRDVPLQNNQSVSGMLGLNYRNPLTSLFGSVLFSYSLSRNNLIYRSSIAPSGALENTAVSQANTSHIQLLTGQLGKYFEPVKTTISSKLSWSTTTSNQFVNGSLITLTNQTLTPSIGLSTNRNKVADIAYSYKISLFETQLSTSLVQHTSQQQHLLSFNIYTKQKCYLSVENEYYINHLTTGVVNNFFTNVLFRYSLPKSKIDLETRWNNVWNTATLITATLSSFSYIESVFELRPMQLMQKIRFSF